jgi:carboxyl-terminal processing protease
VLVVRRPLALLLALAWLVAARPAVAAPASLSALDVIALEIGYTTVLARYYEPVDPVRLLDGARTGIVAYLTSRGIDDPAIPLAPAHADKDAAENAIDRDVALAVLRYGTRIRTADLVRTTIAGELAALHDPYSVVFAPRGYRQFVGFLDGRAVGGIGAELDVDPQTHVVRVVDVFAGGPAANAGIQPGDVIAAIDGAPPPVGTPDAVGAALRGPAGSTVHVGIVRDGVAQPLLALVRRAIVPPDVTGRRLADGIGYVRLRSFGAQSPQQLDAALAGLRGARAYVLDLRGDGGGYRDAAIAIAGRFVHGVVVTTQERGAPPQVFRTPDVPLLGAPFAVLVDGDTASAAEIVAGAIQDAHAATLVGTRTFGKGLVQETFPLPDGGAIKLTTARYRTPAGRDIEGVGIAPDVVVVEPANALIGAPGHDPQLDRALALLGG